MGLLFLSRKLLRNIFSAEGSLWNWPWLKLTCLVQRVGQNVCQNCLGPGNNKCLSTWIPWIAAWGCRNSTQWKASDGPLSPVPVVTQAHIENSKEYSYSNLRFLLLETLASALDSTQASLAPRLCFDNIARALRMHSGLQTREQSLRPSPKLMPWFGKGPLVAFPSWVDRPFESNCMVCIWWGQVCTQLYRTRCVDGTSRR